MSATAPRLQLPEVTLVCVDMGLPAASLAALQHCMRLADFGEVLLFTDPTQVQDAPREVHLRGLQLTDARSHAEFMLEELAPHVYTSHALIVRHDAFVRDVAQWNPDFLLYDYIGAPMRGVPAACSVGHGAFSLRSRRLLAALRKAGVAADHADDLAICQTHRRHLELVHDIRFAPPEMALRFSQAWPAESMASFGFQGLQHLPQVLPAKALRALVAQLPDALLQGADGLALCAAMVRAGQLDGAADILAARGRDGRRDLRSLAVRAQLAVARWHHRRQSAFHA
ncbi:DUF5672 family protein [Aquabacterium sp. OR-4]|uniref:DUF5672 family protein n=1 Tax=Aquabacterium sp. OR-4 TaxID=2978127 RepID=UPI0021B2EA83|nr:DUF5672 family protein [Aquabacterium sp. OR-4]MDT7836844.1 DUF5672 family protein [Aquabacterium sp. OR-4]